MTRLALLAALALSSRAYADDHDARARAKASEATALFSKDDFAGAAAKFTEAYELNRDPSYLFNIAQAYRHAGDCERAAEYYGRFLSEVPHPPNEDKIRGWYTAQSACAKAHATTTAVVTTPKAEPPKAEPPKPDAVKQPPTTPAIDTRSQDQVVTGPSSGVGGHRRLAAGLAGAGGVALGVGVLFAWDAHYLGSQRDALLARCSVASPCSSALVRDYNDRGSRANTLAIVGFAAGGVAIAAGLTMLVLSEGHGDSVIAVVPARGGAVASGAFTW
jgi:tetratricopeptide (TPR) repeat protein